MTFTKLLNSKLIHLIPAGIVLILAVLVRLIDPAPIAQLRLNVFDQYMRFAPRQIDPSYPVRIVAIDEASMQHLGQWPWPRSTIAHIVENLGDSGAKSIAFDFIMPEPDRMSPDALAQTFEGTPGFDKIAQLAKALPSHDDRLAKSLAITPSILGFSASNEPTTSAPKQKSAIVKIGDQPQNFVPNFTGAVSSLKILNNAARGLGAVNWIPDGDHILRRVPLVVKVKDKIYPSLPLEALRVAQNQSTVAIYGSGGSRARAFGNRSGIETVKLGRYALPTNQRGEMWLHYANPDPARYIPAHMILDDAFDKTTVNGRHIFIGATATGLFDLRATPLSDTVPGVEIHAQALEQMLSGKHLTRPAYALGLELVFLVATGALIAWLIGAAGPLTAALLATLAIISVTGASWLAFTSGGVLFDAVYPSLALAALYVAGSLTTYIHSERERYRVRTAFGAYVAPQLVEQLAADPTKLKLGGQTREVTVLFSDVRQFSKISERLDAEQLIAFVNRLFTPLADIILEERGTIDKFMGDAVMAFWNAPVEDPDHARQACRAALRMMDTLDQLNQDWGRKVRARRQTYEPVRIGIGLNTGACCVGNVGSPQRFDYSILGDVVNVASRLESVTKTYGAGIIVGERLVEVANDFAFLELDRVTLKGKSEPQMIYALIGDETVRSSATFKTLRTAHNDLLKAIGSQDWTRAETALNTCRNQAIPAYDPIHDHFKGKLTER